MRVTVIKILMRKCIGVQKYYFSLTGDSNHFSHIAVFLDFLKSQMLVSYQVVAISAIEVTDGSKGFCHQVKGQWTLAADVFHEGVFTRSKVAKIYRDGTISGSY
jgi:hypothetical protein